MAKQLIVILSFLAGLTACINEDLSGCGATYAVTYEAWVDMSVRDTLEARLDGKVAEAMIDTLESVIAPAFDRHLHDLSLVFFTPAGQLANSVTQQASGGRHEASFYLTPDAYAHEAISVDESVAHFAAVRADRRETIGVGYANLSDTIHPVMTPAFSGGTTLEAMGDSALVGMPIHNAVVALVLRAKSGAPLGEASAYLRETASGYAHADSVYRFDRAPVIHTDRLDKAGATAFCANCFPSKEEYKEVLPSDTESEPSGLWEMDVYIRMEADGEITKNTLYISDPLRAGELAVLLMEVNDEGEVEETPEVAVGVELDWKPGLDFELDVEL